MFCNPSNPHSDLNYLEDSSGTADVPVAILPKSDKVVMLQMDSKLPVATFEKVLGAAMTGCHKIYDILVEAVRERTRDLVAARGAASH